MTHRGPFQPLPFCDSVVPVILYIFKKYVVKSKGKKTSCTSNNVYLLKF